MADSVRMAFDKMMKALFNQNGASFSVEFITDPDVQSFVQSHADVLDSAFSQVKMSDAMRRRLQRSDFIFSGMKAFHELNEAFPSLIDDNGNRKPFEQFLNDVRKIDSNYNSNYLRAEYNFVQASAEMAAKWERFSQDGYRYNLQYRTANDNRVRPEHAALHGVTLPISSSFWEEYYPPNGWNCRCTVVQVRKSKFPETPLDEALDRGAEALQKDPKGIFHFNPGIEQKAIPDYNPYTIKRCRDCDIAKGNIKLSRPFVPECDLCQACQLLRGLAQKEHGMRLTKEERQQARDAAMDWARKHLEERTLPNGQVSKQIEVENNITGDSIVIKRDSFKEIFAKNLHKRQLAETMRLATKAEYWIPDARYIRTETGRHHAEQFKVFEAYLENGVTIEFKVMMRTVHMLLYNMRII